jgi:hypothetical protein
MARAAAAGVQGEIRHSDDAKGPELTRDEEVEVAFLVVW